MYAFLLNMWITRRIDAVYLNRVTANGYITEDEKNMILATPQL